MAKKHYKQTEKIFSKSLGPSGRGFEPLHSDQKLSEISDFREFFLFLVCCGANIEFVILDIYF